jgi:hypothetical protein
MKVRTKCNKNLSMVALLVGVTILMMSPLHMTAQAKPIPTPAQNATPPPTQKTVPATPEATSIYRPVAKSGCTNPVLL